MNIDLTFKRNINQVPSDLDIQLLPIISHHFKPDLKPVNVYITTSFSVVLIFIFIAYLVINLVNNQTSFANIFAATGF